MKYEHCLRLNLMKSNDEKSCILFDMKSFKKSNSNLKTNLKLLLHFATKCLEVIENQNSFKKNSTNTQVKCHINFFKARSSLEYVASTNFTIFYKKMNIIIIILTVIIIIRLGLCTSVTFWQPSSLLRGHDVICERL